VKKLCAYIYYKAQLFLAILRLSLFVIIRVIVYSNASIDGPHFWKPSVGIQIDSEITCPTNGGLDTFSFQCLSL